MNYFALNDGTLINLNAIAYFHPEPGPRLSPQRRIEIAFASACRNEVGGIESLTLVLEDQDAAAFLDEMERQGVNVERIRSRIEISDPMVRLPRGERSQ